MRRLALTVAAAALLTAGCATDLPVPGRPATDVVAPGPSVPERAQVPSRALVEGYAITVPRIGARSDLIGLGVNPDRSIQVPALNEPEQMGLYTAGPRPGAVGPAVILGHVSGRDAGGRSVPGVFARLDELAVGDRVDVTTPGDPRVFEVTAVETVAKDAFPTARVYSDTDGPELRLVTCGGVFDAASRNFRDNVIVFAVEVP